MEEEIACMRYNMFTEWQQLLLLSGEGERTSNMISSRNTDDYIRSYDDRKVHLVLTAIYGNLLRVHACHRQFRVHWIFIFTASEMKVKHLNLVADRGAEAQNRNERKWQPPPFLDYVVVVFFLSFSCRIYLYIYPWLNFSGIFRDR